jgi:hypothetical protein
LTDLHAGYGQSEVLPSRRGGNYPSEQVLNFALDIADRVLVREGGNIVHQDARARPRPGDGRALSGGLNPQPV